MAKRFLFRLQPILKLRESLEKEAQRHLARMIALQTAAERNLDDLVRLRAETFDRRRVPAGMIVDLQDWKATERYLVVVDRQILAAEEALALAVRRVLDARQALLTAHRHHLTLLRLRERRQEQHLLETSRLEAREVDDMTVLRYRRSHPDALRRTS